jgi:RNA polymerase sigma-70 factor (ECF subfamily)
MTAACVDQRRSPETFHRYAKGRSDEQLLLEYRRTGDDRLFSELVRRYERELYAFLYRRFDNVTLAEDAFQTAFLRVHARAGQFEEGRKFRPWLYTIATNSAVDLLRRNQRRRSASLNRPLGNHHDNDEGRLLDTLPTTVPSPLDRIENREREAECRDAVSRLPERIRIVVDLIFFQGMKYREAAEVLSIPIGTVKSRLHQAMLKLRADMEDQREGPERSRESRTGLDPAAI